MKKKTFWSIMMLMVMALPLMVACGGDDEGSSGGGAKDEDLIRQAIGTWMCTESTDSQQGQSYNGLMVGKEVTINLNGTYTSTAPTFGYTGTYTVSGNKITAKSNSGGTFVITVTISGDKMTWNGTANNGVTFRYVFVREEDTSHQTYIIPITNDMIAGTTWSVKSFKIDRGSNSSIQNGKTVSFNQDGSCTGFHSMENAWRINSGRIETFYKQTNEPMFVYTLLAQNNDEITVQMNGTLDDDLQATLIMGKVYNQSTTENYWTSKEAVYNLRSTCYAYFAEYEEAQLKLESLRTSPSTVHSITPSSNEVKVAWEAAYRTINVANTIFDNTNQFEQLFSDKQELKTLLAEVRAIRAFVFYNIAMLWGNVPLIKAVPTDVTAVYPQNAQGDVYWYVASEINEIINDLTIPSDKMIVGRDAALILKAELEVTQGNNSSALAALNQVDKNRYDGVISSTTTIEKPVVWAVRKSNTDKYLPIYTYSHIKLYEKEMSGNKDGLETEWKNESYIEHGYWAALKRLKKAQTVTGCYDYELLMPFPSSYIASDYTAVQNTGY